MLDDEDEPKLCAEDLTEFFYLWTTHQEVMSVYEIVRLYTREDSLDPALIERVCEKKGVDFLTALVDLAFIHSGFLTELYKTVDHKTKPETE